jgi:hypothetical protein
MSLLALIFIESISITTVYILLNQIIAVLFQMKVWIYLDILIQYIAKDTLLQVDSGFYSQNYSHLSCEDGASARAIYTINETENLRDYLKRKFKFDWIYGSKIKTGTKAAWK